MINPYLVIVIIIVAALAPSSLQLIGDGRIMNIAEVEVFGDAATQPCAGQGDGKSEANAGLTCKSIKLNFPSSTSGKKAAD